MVRESNRIHQANRVAKARQASGDVPAYWQQNDPKNSYIKSSIGEMTVNGRSVLVTQFPNSTVQGDEALWYAYDGEELRDKYASLLANEGILKGRSSVEVEVDDYNDDRAHNERLLARRLREQDSMKLLCYSNTDLPTALSVAFFVTNGTIVNIEELPPNYVSPRCSQGLAHGALIMRSGWFAANGIQPGDTITPFKSITVRELPNVLARYEQDTKTAPVAGAHWNGLPLTHLNAARRWVGEAEVKASSLMVTMPTKTSFSLNDAYLIDPVTPHVQMRAMQEAAVDQVSVLFKEKLQSLQPWEGVLVPDNEGLLARVIDKTRLHIPLSVAILDFNFKIERFLDWNPGEATDQMVIAPIEKYALITYQDWFAAYGFKVGNTLPLTPMSEGAASRVLAEEQAQREHTIAMIARVKLKKEQDAQFRVIERDFNRLREHYDIDVKFAYRNARIGGSYDDPTPGFLDMLNRLFGGTDRTVNSRAWQCSDRSYTVTIRPKRSIDYVDIARNPNPIVIDATWKLSHVVGGNTSDQGSTSREELKLPLHPTNSVSETFSFNCITDMHTDQGEETSSELRMALADQSAFPVHRSTSTAHINRDAVYAENSRQWNRLNQIIDEHNAQVAARRSSSSYDSGSSSSYNGPSQEKCQGIVDQMQGERVVRSSTRNGLTTGTDSPKYTREQIEAALKREGCM